MLNILLAVLSMVTQGTSDFIYKRAQERGVVFESYFAVECVPFAGVALLAGYLMEGLIINQATVLYGLVFGVFSFWAVYFFVTSLREGEVGVNTLIFRLNFVLVAVFAILWLGEPWTAAVGAGLIFAALGIASVTLLRRPPEDERDGLGAVDRPCSPGHDPLRHAGGHAENRHPGGSEHRMGDRPGLVVVGRLRLHPGCREEKVFDAEGQLGVPSGDRMPESGFVHPDAVRIPKGRERQRGGSDRSAQLPGDDGLGRNVPQGAVDAFKDHRPRVRRCRDSGLFGPGGMRARASSPRLSAP